MTVLVVVETGVLVVLTVLVAGLLRAYADVLRRLHQLDGGGSTSVDERRPFRTAEGVPAPQLHQVGGRDTWDEGHDVGGVSPSGELVRVRALGVEHDTVLVFLSSGCTGCVAFWEELGTPAASSMSDGSRLVVVTKGPLEESPGLVAQLWPEGVDLVMSSEAWADYEVPGSPFVVVVDGRSGRIKGQGSGGSFGQIQSLLAQAGGDGSVRSPHPPGAGRDREEDVDQALLLAGIRPGDPSLYGGEGHAGPGGREP